jgi:hypothetical protein
MINKTKSTLLVFLFTCLVLIAAWMSHIITLRTITSKQAITESDESACNDTNLMFEKLPSYLKNNEYAVNLLRKECSFVTDSFLQDVNNDGNDEIFMQTTSLFCGNASCKDRTIYILNANEELFYASGFDMHFEKTTEPNQFNVVEQVRHWDDSPCCSNQNLTIKYKYNQKLPLLFEPVETELVKNE